MRRRWAQERLVRRGAVMMTALAVGLAGALGAVPTSAGAADPLEATPLSVPGMPVSLAQAGELGLWGDNTFSQSTVPSSLAGVAISQVVLTHGATIALTADGKVVAWGSNPDRLERVPAEVAAAKVAQIAVSTYGGGYAGAVTSDGRVLTWGKKRAFATPLDVPAGLSGVKQLAIGEYAAMALRHDGTVVAWGQPDFGQTAVPPGLTAQAITADATRFFALTTQGTVVAWGAATTLPPSLQVPGNVKAIASATNISLALLADNTLVPFGTILTPPAELLEADPVLLANGGSAELGLVDRDRTIHYWASPGTAVPGQVPASLNGRDISQIALGFGQSSSVSIPSVVTGGVIVTKLLRAQLPTVTGAATVGSVLTGTPGTFSATPDSVTSQWLVGGVPAGGGTQLAVTAAMAGKTIAYQSTATKAGHATISSTSGAVTVPAVVQPPPPPAPKVGSSTRVLKVTVAKKAASLVVAGKVKATKSPSGKATVTIKKGKKTIIAKAVAVSAAGALKLTVKKFGALVAKKLKAKGRKARTAYRGTYSVRIAYAGNSQVKASSASGRFAIKR